MSGEDLAILITAVALSTAQQLTVTDMNILAAALSQLADVYSTISVIRSFEEERNESATQEQEEESVALETG